MQRISSFWKEHITARVWHWFTRPKLQLTTKSLREVMGFCLFSSSMFSWLMTSERVRGNGIIYAYMRYRKCGSNMVCAVSQKRSRVDSSVVLLKLGVLYLICTSIKLHFHGGTDKWEIDRPLITPWSNLWWLVSKYTCGDWSCTLTTLRRGSTTAVHGKLCFCLFPRALLNYREHCCAFLHNGWYANWQGCGLHQTVFFSDSHAKRWGSLSWRALATFLSQASSKLQASFKKASNYT